jgi:hypothetical protein
MEHGRQDRLDQLLASYGADRRRWPEADRHLLADEHAAVAEAAGIDRLLGFASAPPALPDGALSRMMDRIPEERPAEVILFRPRPQRPSLFRFAAAVPLAASLALGIYLGAKGTLDFMLPASVTGDVAQADDTGGDLGGVDELDAYVAENFS